MEMTNPNTHCPCCRKNENLNFLLLMLDTPHFPKVRPASEYIQRLNDSGCNNTVEPIVLYRMKRFFQRLQMNKMSIELDFVD